jgi:hypothetical protein
MYATLAYLRGQHVKTTGLSMMLIPTKPTCVPLVLVLLPVLVMAALSPILWLTFTKENSKFIPYIYVNNLLILSLILKAKKC